MSKRRVDAPGRGESCGDARRRRVSVSRRRQTALDGPGGTLPNPGGKLRALILATVVGFSLLAMASFAGPVAAAGNDGLLAGGNAAAPPMSPAINVDAVVMDSSSPTEVTVGYNFEGESYDPAKTQLTLSDPNDHTQAMDSQNLDGLGKKGTATVTIDAGTYANVETYEVSLDNDANGFVDNDRGGLETRAVGSSSSVDVPDFQTRGNGETDIRVGYNAAGEDLSGKTLTVRMSDNVGNSTQTADLSADPKGLASITVPDADNFQRGTTTFELLIDGSALTSTTAEYTLEPYVSAKTIAIDEGPGDASNVDVRTETMSFGPQSVMQLDLVDSTQSKFRDFDLSGSGVNADESTLLSVDLTVENFDPDLLQGPGDVQSWDTTDNGDGSTDITISVKPTSVFWNQTAYQSGGFDPTAWQNNWEVADYGMDSVVSLGISDMPDKAPMNKLSGARLTTDAQFYSPPNVDPKTNVLSVDVAAPHCQDDASSYDASSGDCVGGTVNDDGFYTALVPKAMADTMWPGIDVDALAGSYNSGGTAADLEMTVTEQANGDLLVELSNIHYSSGTIELEEDTTAPTADAGSNVAVDEGESFSFDGSASSDNRKISAYEWDVDDDGTYELTGEAPSHSYDSAGDYTVTLRVTDGNDNTDTDTVTVSVSGTSSGGSGSMSIPSDPDTDTSTATPDSAESDDSTETAATDTAEPTATEQSTPETTDTEQQTAGQDGPGFGSVGALVALLAVVTIRRRRGS